MQFTCSDFSIQITKNQENQPKEEDDDCIKGDGWTFPKVSRFNAAKSNTFGNIINYPCHNICFCKTLQAIRHLYSYTEPAQVRGRMRIFGQTFVPSKLIVLPLTSLISWIETFWNIDFQVGSPAESTGEKDDQSKSKLGSFLDRFKKKIRPETTEEEMVHRNLIHLLIYR